MLTDITIITQLTRKAVQSGLKTENHVQVVHELTSTGIMVYTNT